MAKKLRQKTMLSFLLLIVCIVVFGLFLTKMQTSLSVNNQRENTQEKLDEMQEIIDSADETANQNNLSYDEVY